MVCCDLYERVLGPSATTSKQLYLTEKPASIDSRDVRMARKKCCCKKKKRGDDLVERRARFRRLHHDEKPMVEDRDPEFHKRRAHVAKVSFGRSHPSLQRIAELVPVADQSEMPKLARAITHFKDLYGDLTCYTDARGRNLLWHAVNEECETTVALLIRAGVAPLRSNFPSDDPIALAMDKKNFNIVDMLQANRPLRVRDSFKIKVVDNSSYNLMRDGQYKIPKSSSPLASPRFKFPGLIRRFRSKDDDFV